jgi:hypothetical protein
MADNVTTEGKNIKNADPYNVSGTEKRYQNITIAIDPVIHRAVKIMAINEETTISNIMGEAVSCWIKWMRKAELKEQALLKKDAESLAIAKERLRKAEELLAYAQAKKKEQRSKKAKTKREKKHDKKMQAAYPYLDWKRAKNLPGAPRNTRRKKSTSNVAESAFQTSQVSPG